MGPALLLLRLLVVVLLLLLLLLLHPLLSIEDILVVGHHESGARWIHFATILEVSTTVHWTRL